jgi:hypothetical protein
MVVSTPHSSKNTRRSGATPPTPVRIGPPGLACPGHVLALLLGRAQAQLLSRPARPPQRPVHGGQVHAHAVRLGQPRRDLGQARVIGAARQPSMAASTAPRMRGAGPPRIGLASRRPSSRAAAPSGTPSSAPTANRRAAASGVSPASTAASTRLAQVLEYGPAMNTSARHKGRVV